MEQALVASEASTADKTAVLAAARLEFESAMTIRQNQDKAALATKQTQLGDQLNEERRLFIEKLEAEYRPLLFNIDLKLKTVQHSPTDAQALQQEKTRLEAERQQKLKSKEDELGARFQKEMDATAQELAGQSDSYAKKWMDDRMQELQKPVVSPEQEKQRQEIVDLSSRMIQEVRTAVNKVAGQEKIDIVWLKQAVRKPVKDITDAVAREITNGK
jgi:Skp family chaperone for outer membrane proteins